MSETKSGRRASSLLAAVTMLGTALGVGPAVQAQTSEARKAGGKPVEYGRPGDSAGAEACAQKLNPGGGDPQAWSWGASNSGRAKGPGAEASQMKVTMTDVLVSGKAGPTESRQAKHHGATQSNQNKIGTGCVEGNFQKIELGD